MAQFGSMFNSSFLDFSAHSISYDERTAAASTSTNKKRSLLRNETSSWGQPARQPYVVFTSFRAWGPAEMVIKFTAASSAAERMSTPL